MEFCSKMILKYRTLLELARIVARPTKNNKHVTFSPSVVLSPEIKKLFKNVQISKLCLQMILEHKSLLELMRTVARTAENNQYVTFSSNVVLAQDIKKLFKNIQITKLCLK